MTIKTFWTIFLKILGIWLLLESVTVVPQFFVLLLNPIGFENTINSFLLTTALLLLTVGIFVFILWLFLFKTAWLISKLRLDKGFTEEKIELNARRSTVLSIATIVIGGLMLVDSLPLFCKLVFTSFQQKEIFGENPNSGWIIFHLAKTIFGYLLMTNSLFIVNFIEKRSKTQNDETE